MCFFLVDCLFVAQIYLDGDEQFSTSEKWILFSFGVFFVILPLICNLMQLHNEIKVWMSDIHSKHTVQAWIRSYLHFLFLMAIVFGSAFAAVDICNSNIFHLRMFNMGLNRRQRAIFKNQRILSIVIFENIPQLALQISFLILSKQSSISAITLMAMIFSLISIVSSIFSYKSSSMLIKCETITLIEMDIESTQLANLQSQQFRQMVVHHRIPICIQLAKIIHINPRLIEILIPVQTTTGVKMTLYIRNNDHDSPETMVNLIVNQSHSGALANVCKVKMVFLFEAIYYMCFIFRKHVFDSIYRCFFKFGKIMV